MRSIQAQAIKTRIFTLGEDLAAFIIEHLPKSLLNEGTVLCVTSKLVSLSERSIVYKSDVSSKMDLVRAESDQFLSECAYGTALTIKHGILIPAAGIDESNAADDYYILFPKDPYSSARTLYERLRNHYGIREFGLIITDSHTLPLRRGVVGIGLAHFGFRATRNLIGHGDLFARPLTMTSIDVLDALSVAAVYVMGEADECSPLALVKADGLEFTESGDPSEIRIPREDDLYFPLLK
jgi:F420-0:gamma-glutamyl ligase